MCRSLGIDLAAQNEKTATCVIDWSSGRAVARAPVLGGAGDDVEWLVAQQQEADWTGIDAPFGWPLPFVEATSRWAAGEAWDAADKDDLRFRHTDQVVRATVGRVALSVSSDRIAVTAWRCARLLDAVRDGEKAVDRLGADRIYEVYPGAALTCWGFTRAGYKTSGNAQSKQRQRQARVALLDEIERRAGWLDLSLAREACEKSDDALDALIASLVARAAGTGRTVLPEAHDEAQQRRIAAEGWIHLPRDRTSLDELAQPRSLGRV